MHVDTPTSLCQVGLARGDITPPVGIYHRMWGAAAHDRSTGVHRPLTATAMALRPGWGGLSAGRPSGEGGETKTARKTAPRAAGGEGLADPPGGDEQLVLLAVDHCLLWGDAMDELLTRLAEAASAPRERLLVMFSHTHGAGLMDRRRADLPGGELIGPYLDSLADALAGLVRAALDDLAPALITYGLGHCSLAANRDLWDAARGHWVCGFNPQGTADDTLLVARVCDLAGYVRGVLVNYACHPTTLAWDNTLISPDYLGAMREVVESAVGAPVFFMQGASGDLGPRRGFTGDVRLADSNGRQLGYAALAAWEGLPSPATRQKYVGPVVSGAVIGVWNDVPLAAEALRGKAIWRRRAWTIDMEYRPGLPTAEELAAQRERQVSALAAAQAAGDDALARECRARVEVASRQLGRLRSLKTDRPYAFPIQLWQIGDAIWAAVESEHYQLLQTSLRRRFPQRTILIATIVNGSLHTYLPPRELYGTGVYQETVALLAPGSAERLIDEIAAQIEAWECL